MTIVDFFNPNDIEHVKAFNFFQKNSRWPESFVVPDHDINFYPSQWNIDILKKISEYWLIKKYAEYYENLYNE